MKSWAVQKDAPRRPVSIPTVSSWWSLATRGGGRVVVAFVLDIGVEEEEGDGAEPAARKSRIMNVPITYGSVVKRPWLRWVK